MREDDVAARIDHRLRRAGQPVAPGRQHRDRAGRADVIVVARMEQQAVGAQGEPVGGAVQRLELKPRQPRARPVDQHVRPCGGVGIGDVDVVVDVVEDAGVQPQPRGRIPLQAGLVGGDLLRIDARTGGVHGRERGALEAGADAAIGENRPAVVLDPGRVGRLRAVLARRADIGDAEQVAGGVGLNVVLDAVLLTGVAAPQGDGPVCDQRNRGLAVAREGCRMPGVERRARGQRRQVPGQIGVALPVEVEYAGNVFDRRVDRGDLEVFLEVVRREVA